MRRPPQPVGIEGYPPVHVRVLTRGEMRALSTRDKKLYPNFDTALVAVALCDADGKRIHPPVNGPLPDPAVVASFEDEDYPYMEGVGRAVLAVNGLGKEEEGKAGGSPGSGSTSS